MVIDEGMFSLTDGIELAFLRDGDAPPGAMPLIYHHGTPAAGPMDPLLLSTARAAGYRLIELVRPGYNASTRQPGRRVVDVVPLTAALADHLGIDEFVTLGWSGGGPHALATAAELPGRCVGAVSLASVAPYGAPGLDFLAGMGEENIIEFSAALRGPEPLTEYLAAATPELATVTGPDVIAALSSLLPTADRAYLTGDAAEGMASQLRWSLSSGWWGWFDDDIAFTMPWGFNLRDITVPIVALQGTEDLMVPASHGRWLAEHLPENSMRMLTGEGHLSIISELEHELTALRARLP